MPSMTTTTPSRLARRRALLAGAAVPLLLLAACGGGGSEAAPTTTTAAKATTTTGAEASDTTTTEAEPADVEESAVDDLPTGEDAAPHGDWISVRFQVAQEPEPEGFQPGYGEARLYDITPDCDDDGCVLTLEGGGPDGSFALPDVAPITGDPIVLEPDGDSWTYEYTEPEPYGCTDELDGPYLSTTETRDLDPVYGDDGEVSGLVGSTVYVDTLTAEGKAAGCPANVEGTYGYVTVMAPNDGIGGIDEYEVDGTFRQTVEVTQSEGYTDPTYQVGGANVTIEGHDLELEGGCADGECSVDLTQINGDGNERQAELVSEDGLALLGTYDERSGCLDDETGERLFDDSAYDATGAYEDLIPVWVEDGEVKAFVGRFYHSSTPTELGETEPSCSYEQSEAGWAYLVDTSIFDGV